MRFIKDWKNRTYRVFKPREEWIFQKEFSPNKMLSPRALTDVEGIVLYYHGSIENEIMKLRRTNSESRKITENAIAHFYISPDGLIYEGLDLDVQANVLSSESKNKNKLFIALTTYGDDDEIEKDSGLIDSVKKLITDLLSQKDGVIKKLPNLRTICRSELYSKVEKWKSLRGKGIESLIKDDSLGLTWLYEYREKEVIPTDDGLYRTEKSLFMKTTDNDYDKTNWEMIIETIEKIPAAKLVWDYYKNQDSHHIYFTVQEMVADSKGDIPSGVAIFSNNDLKKPLHESLEIKEGKIIFSDLGLKLFPNHKTLANVNVSNSKGKYISLISLESKTFSKMAKLAFNAEGVKYSTASGNLSIALFILLHEITAHIYLHSSPHNADLDHNRFGGAYVMSGVSSPYRLREGSFGHELAGQLNKIIYANEVPSKEQLETYKEQAKVKLESAKNEK